MYGCVSDSTLGWGTGGGFFFIFGTKGTDVLFGWGGVFSFYSLYSNQATLICPFLMESETYKLIHVSIL